MALYTILVRPSGGDPTQVETDADRALLGRYSSSLNDAGLTPGEAAEAVIEAFHQNFGIDNVDDLVIEVFDATGQVVERAEESKVPDVEASEPEFESEDYFIPTTL